jgi:hypothetical protein
MAHTPAMPPNRHVPFKKGGWGAAILTTAAAVGAFLTAYYIHTQTYRHPRDVMMREVYEQPAAGEGRHQTAGGPATPAESKAPAH